MTTQQENLWQKIATYRLDDPEAAVNFTIKLAHKQRWSMSYARRVVAEYKKFIFLCIDTPKGASPSHEVDEAWHLHLTYTEDYARFCQSVAGRFIHHIPSKGGQTEKEHHTNWYEVTLKNYVLAFDQLPPDGIWTIPTNLDLPHYLSQKSAFKPIKTDPFDTSIEAMPPQYKVAMILITVATGCFFLSIYNPFSLKGFEFLVFYLLSGVTTLIYVFLMTNSSKKILIERFEALGSELTTYHLAFLVGGKERVFQTLVLELADADILKRHSKVLKINDLSKFKTKMWQHPMRYALETHEDEIVLNDFLEQTANVLSQQIERDLIRIRLVDDAAGTQQIVSLGFRIVGGLRMLQGFLMGHPIVFLGLMVTVHWMINKHIKFGKTERIAFIKELFANRNKYQNAEQYALRGRTALTTSSLTETALLVALVATDWEKRDYTNGHDGSNSFSCGGGCGASGCGGGGCGGGCGGCGG